MQLDHAPGGVDRLSRDFHLRRRVVRIGLRPRPQRERNLVVAEALGLQQEARRVLRLERRGTLQHQGAIFPGGARVVLTETHPGEHRLAAIRIVLGDVVEDDLAVIAHVVVRDRQLSDDLPAVEGIVRGVGDVHVHADSVIEPVLAILALLHLQDDRLAHRPAQVFLKSRDLRFPARELLRQAEAMAHGILEQRHP